MDDQTRRLIDRLETQRRLTQGEYATLIRGFTTESAAYLAQKAHRACQRVYGNRIFIRGLIEISNYCRNDCYYCGIRRSNPNCDRYRLSDEEILACCEEGYRLGFRTFVLQGGEGSPTDWVCQMVRAIKDRYPSCAITLSLGEYPRADYQAMFQAGADRYLLRHETADPAHYASLHPPALSLSQRMACLANLREIGFQTGCGFMVGSPGQTPDHLAADLSFAQDFAPAMCGVGPFIPHQDTPLGDQPPGSAALTCYLLSILRLMDPKLLLPATTALGSLDPQGRQKGILAGANVVMPNLSPAAVRDKYALYNGKLSTGKESAQNLADLRISLAEIGREIVTARGDYPHALTERPL